MKVGIFLSAHLSSFTYLFVPTEDPVNSKWILFTAGVVGDYSGFSKLYILNIIYILKVDFPPDPSSNPGRNKNAAKRYLQSKNLNCHSFRQFASRCAVRKLRTMYVVHAIVYLKPIYTIKIMYMIFTKLK